MRFASFLSSGFTTMAVIDPPESKLAKWTSFDWWEVGEYISTIFHKLNHIKSMYVLHLPKPSKLSFQVILCPETPFSFKLTHT